VPKELLLNPYRRKVLRKRIPASEVIACVCVMLALLGIALWIAAQRTAFDPENRNLPAGAGHWAAASVSIQSGNLPGDSAATGSLREDSSPDLGIVSSSVLDNAWQLDGAVEEYDPSTVFQKIDGAAEQYLERGFVRLHYLALVRGEEFISVELYDQGTPANAEEIWTRQRSSDGADERMGPLSYALTSVGATGVVSRYFFKIVGSDSTASIADKTLALLEQLSQLPAVQPETQTVPPSMAAARSGGSRR